MDYKLIEHFQSFLRDAKRTGDVRGVETAQEALCTELQKCSQLYYALVERLVTTYGVDLLSPLEVEPDPHSDKDVAAQVFQLAVTMLALALALT